MLPTALAVRFECAIRLILMAFLCGPKSSPDHAWCAQDSPPPPPPPGQCSNMRLVFIADKPDSSSGLEAFELPLAYVADEDFRQPILFGELRRASYLRLEHACSCATILDQAAPPPRIATMGRWRAGAAALAAASIAAVRHASVCLTRPPVSARRRSQQPERAVLPRGGRPGRGRGPAVHALLQGGGRGHLCALLFQVMAQPAAPVCAACKRRLVFVLAGAGGAVGGRAAVPLQPCCLLVTA